MRKPFRLTLLAGAVGTAILTAGLVLTSHSATSQTGGAAANDQQPTPTASPAEKQSASALPLTHVHLFSSGVGYFQREGVVDGNTRIELTFPSGNISDLL